MTFETACSSKANFVSMSKLPIKLIDFALKIDHTACVTLIRKYQMCITREGGQLEQWLQY